MRINTAEQQELKLLAEVLRRSQSDAVRYLIGKATKALSIDGPGRVHDKTEVVGGNGRST